MLKAIHFSNAIGMNATAGGFYLTGDEYSGQYGRSLWQKDKTELVANAVIGKPALKDCLPLI